MSDDVVEDLALGAFRLVKEKLAFELDFTTETLPVLDHYLRTLRDEDDGRPDEKAVALVAPCAGVYFGEVVRRSLPGFRWHRPMGEPETDYREWRLEASHVFLCFNPIGAALEALYGEPLAGWHAHLSLLPAQQGVVEASLAASGAVREDDFHRLAVRHEVLEQAMSVLEELERQDAEPRSFGPEAYASLVDGSLGPIEA